MWSIPSSIRSASVHSTSQSISSLHSYDSENSSGTAVDNDSFNDTTGSQLWHPQDGLAKKLQQESPKIAEIESRPLITMYRLNQEANRLSKKETHSQITTLGSEEAFEQPEKTPTLLPATKYVDSQEVHLETQQNEAHGRNEASQSRVPGPLEQQLSALMSKIIYMERENPTITVTPEEYQAMQEKIKTLEAEKVAMAARYEALWALRDEDVANLIKVRVLLAEERWEHANMRKLRDDDIGNVISLRNKLAEATRKIEALEKSSGRISPSRRPRSIVSVEGRTTPSRENAERRDTIERRETLDRRNATDLFQAARTAALEQRALELEKANEDLQRQMAAMKLEGVSSPEVEQRWQAKVNELEAQLQQKEDELSQARAHNSSAKVNELEIQLQQKEDQLSQARAHKSSASSDAMTWNRIEGMVDENTKYRVRVARQMQQLRSEKEILQRELNQKEDENAELEARVEKLQRFSNAGLLQRILS